MSLQRAYDRYLPRVEAEMRDLVSSSRPGRAGYYGMMHYHLGWRDETLAAQRANSGKRLRPILCLLACEAAGGDPVQALPAACAVELVHSFSLVHDDIQDGSPTRRGRRAVWDIWGTAHGINVGDGLFVLARLALHRLAERGVPLERCAAAGRAFDEACLALCEGQFLDMSFEERPQVTMDEYVEMIGCKTAALLSASSGLGAAVAADQAHLVELYARFGHNLGMAFQIQDDILGIWGDEAVTGKSAATDLRDRKKTLPVVYALGAGDSAAGRRLAELYARPGNLDADEIRLALELLDRSGARAFAEEQSGQYARVAVACLEETGIANPAQATLRQLPASLLGRAA